MDALAKAEAYLKTDRSLSGGRTLYNLLPGKNKAFQNILARFTDTQPNLAKLHYEIAKAVKMPERKLKMLLQQPIANTTATKAPVEDAPQPLTLDDKLIAFNEKDADYQAAKQLAKDLGLKPKSRKKADVYEALTTARTALVKKK
ncbi:hypothetical protein [Winogradskyella pulchriflava]|uniref:Rho termination factor-like protein n=1 Tax=Winogradskyella pulchriflava TaxID=1110688 RepID=A0ABV6QCE6_9FLAO